MQTPNVPTEAASRRIGSCVTIVILFFVVVFVIAAYLLFNRKGVELFQTTLNLQFNGVKTTGTVSSVEEFSDGDPAFQTYSYKLIVEFQVDGKTYLVKGNSYYPSKQNGWAGEPVEVIYDPKDPNSAMIDNFDERWLIPIGEAAP